MFPLQGVEKGLGRKMIGAFMILMGVPFPFLDQPLKAMFGIVIANMVIFLRV